MSVIKIDNKVYNVGEVQMTRNAEIIYDPLTQGVMLDFSEMDDAVATKYVYSFTVERRVDSANGIAEYDAFYYDITTPKSVRLIELPFGNGRMVFKAKIKAVSDNLNKSYGGENKWSGLTVTFEPIAPQRYADETAKFMYVQTTDDGDKTLYIKQINQILYFSIDGSTWIQGKMGEKGEKGDTGATGPRGPAGKDGLTPYIGANGNWWIGSTDTTLSANWQPNIDNAVKTHNDSIESHADKVAKVDFTNFIMRNVKSVVWGAQSGVLKILIPKSTTSYDIELHIASLIGKSAKLRLGGSLNGSANTWSNTSAILMSPENRITKIKFGYDVNSDKACIWIYGLSGIYATATITQVIYRHSGGTLSFVWDMLFSEDEAGITNIVECPVNWAMTDDGVWRDFDLLNGFTQYASMKPQYRKIGNIVYCRGFVTPPSGDPSGITIAMLPAQYRPSENFAALVPLASSNGGGYARLSVNASGAIAVDYTNNAVALSVYAMLNISFVI